MVIRNQFGRRNLNNYNRSVLALKLKTILAERARENQEVTRFGAVRQNSGKPIEPVHTDKELAKLAHTSHDTIHKVSVIENTAPEEIKQQARSGEISVNQA